MKQKTHSGLKKRIKVRKSGSVSVSKSCKNHLLSNKSKRQKKSFMGGMPVNNTRMQSIRRLMPGKVQLSARKVKAKQNVDKKVKK